MGSCARYGRAMSDAKNHRRKRRQPERDLQTALVKALPLVLAPDVVWFHVPNGGSRNIREAKNLQRMGVLPGVPDLLFLRRNLPPLFVELKAPKGRASKAQREVGERLKKAVCTVAVVDSMDAAVLVLRVFGFSRLYNLLACERKSAGAQGPGEF